MKRLFRLIEAGLECPTGGFFVDPSLPVPTAVVTHAHADHATPGCGTYHVASEGIGLFRKRLGADARLIAHEYGEEFTLGSTVVSLHPAGHVMGSAQVRVIGRDAVGERSWVVSGDYKLAPDPTCTPFQSVQTDTFITEATFAMPIFKWPDPTEVYRQIDDWWRSCQTNGKVGLVTAYSLGKAQRLLAGVDSSIGPIFTHGAVEALNGVYRDSLKQGLLPETSYVGSVERKVDFEGGLIVAPPSVLGSNWLRRFGSIETAFASGWMTIRGRKRRRSVDRGFVLSDHADWPNLLRAIDQSGAQEVFATHGYVNVLTRWLSERGFNAAPLESLSPEGALNGAPE